MNQMEKQIRVAGLLVALGLIVLFVSLIPNQALAFVIFTIVGAPLLMAGIVWYLISLLRRPSADENGRTSQ